MPLEQLVVVQNKGADIDLEIIAGPVRGHAEHV